MPKRIYQGPHANGCEVVIPGGPTLIFPNRKDPVEVSAEDAAALDLTGEYIAPPSKPKATKAADKSEED